MSLFIYCSFNEAAGSTDYIIEWWLMSNELEGTRKEGVMDSFTVGALSWNLPGGTQKSHEKLQQDSRYQGKGLNTGGPEYEGLLTTRPDTFCRI
jgi:hypothetical protein